MDNINNEIKIYHLENVLSEDSDSDNTNVFTSSLLDLYDNIGGNPVLAARAGLAIAKSPTGRKIVGKVIGSQAKRVIKKENVISTLKKKVEVTDSEDEISDVPKTDITRDTLSSAAKRITRITDKQILSTVDGEKESDTTENSSLKENKPIKKKDKKGTKTKKSKKGTKTKKSKKGIKIKKGGSIENLTEKSVNNYLNTVNNELKQLFDLLEV